MAKATLLVIQGIDQGARFELGDEPVGIGRGIQNEVRLLDTETSRRHASLAPREGRWVLTDEGSSNGTFVNGRPIRAAELNHGDQIQIGRCVMLFSLESVPGENRAAMQVTMLGEDRSSIVGMGVPTEGGDLTLPIPFAAAQSPSNLQVLYGILEEISRPWVALQPMLQRILDLTLPAIGADRGCILLRKPPPGELEPAAFSPARRAGNGEPMPVSKTIVDYVLKNRQGVRTSDARSDARFVPGQSILQGGIREAICVPMAGRHELLGVIYVDISTPPERILMQGGSISRFTEEMLRLVMAIGRQSALAIEEFQYQQALVKAERFGAVAHTITTLSHHVKNILQGIRGGSYLIELGLDKHDEEIVRKGWRIVERNQTKIYNLVMDMLTFSKERQPAWKVAALNDVVQEVCELMQARCEECGVAFEAALADNLPASQFDPEGIHRAVLNIVTNAVDAVEGQPGGKVRVETGVIADRKSLCVSVSDNGPGIAPEMVPRLFSLFESTKGSRGTGLGLAVSQKILREHGGEILVESAPSAGSRFLLVWPIVDEDRHGSDVR